MRSMPSKKRSVERCSQFGFLGVTEEAAAEHRRKGDGDQPRNQDRDADSDGEFTKQPAQQTRHEQDGDEDGGQRDGHGDDGEADLARAAEGGLHGALASLQVAHDVLQHHDGIIDHEADAENQRHQRQIVEAVIEQVHDGKRADDGERQGHGWNQSGRGVAQEQEDHQDDEDHGGGHSDLDVVEGLANGLGPVAADFQLDGRRNLRLKRGQQALDLVGGLDRIGAGLLHNHEIDGAAAATLVVVQRSVLVVLHAIDYVRHLLQPDRDAVAPGDDRPVGTPRRSSVGPIA